MSHHSLDKKISFVSNSEDVQFGVGGKSYSKNKDRDFNRKQGNKAEARMMRKAKVNPYSRSSNKVQLHELEY